MSNLVSIVVEQSGCGERACDVLPRPLCGRGALFGTEIREEPADLMTARLPFLKIGIDARGLMAPQVSLDRFSGGRRGAKPAVIEGDADHDLLTSAADAVEQRLIDEVIVTRRSPDRFCERRYGQTRRSLG